MRQVEVVATYAEEPNFPAERQKEGAERYKVGELWVDAIGGEPTQKEIDDMRFDRLRKE